MSRWRLYLSWQVLNSSFNFHNGCRYRTFKEDYIKTGDNTDHESVDIDPKREDQYKNWCSDGSNVGDTIKQSDVWLHVKGLDPATFPAEETKDGNHVRTMTREIREYLQAIPYSTTATFCYLSYFFRK